MPSAKDIVLRPVPAKDAHRFVRRHHYSGTSVQNSQLHLGIFLADRFVGVLQFGPSMDKRKLVGLVAGTGWNEFIELNRLAMVDDTPRNTESRALAVAMRIIRRQYPHLQWVVSFADATQCGDGTIYRASGFVLTGIKKNTQIWVMSDDSIATRASLTDTKSRAARSRTISRLSAAKGKAITDTGGASMKPFQALGARPVPGFQLRYIYFLDSTAKARLTVPEIPFARIAEVGAGMYKGKRRKDSSEPSAHHAEEGGAAPTPALQ